MPLEQRLAGILLHPTSLPGPYGVGDLGPSVDEFLDWTVSAGLAYWQILPLGPTGFGDSPYQCFSAFAGNPLLISPQLLAESKLLSAEDIAPPTFPVDRVDYGWAIQWKCELLRKAFKKWQDAKSHKLRAEYDRWTTSPTVASWLDNYALFMACKDDNGGRCWNEWEPKLRAFDKSAVAAARKRLTSQADYYRFAQFLFFHQWSRVRVAAKSRNIQIIGDAPIYVSYDSADTWANQHLFQLAPDGNPTGVAGVPPDYFSATGQLWGNPLYDWDRMEKDGFSWWADRLRATFETVDIVRLDHFRGFMGYYSVPFGHPTAEHGTWVKGPGARFFAKMGETLGSLPIIAEDLGEITNDVTEVRRQFNLPGMVILQFAWTPALQIPIVSDPNNHFLPHRHERESVVYTGTHDNDTTIGWWRHSSTPAERTTMQLYLSTDGNLANWDLIRAGMRSVANTFVAPAQDLLNLDTEHRMNFPGKSEGNWSWRLKRQMSPELATSVRELTLLYGRCNNPPEQALPQAPKAPLY